MMEYGLVLSGGGMRGAYQIGVWKALCEMKINITAVSGASIGAINGAMFVQGDGGTAEKFWRQIQAEDIMIPSISVKPITEGIFDMSPLERILKNVINEKKLRKSPVDFGIAAFSLQQKTGICKFKADIPNGKIVDYLMASACVPLVKAREIDGDTLIDGGVSNNTPVNMLVEKNMKNIISVDIKGIGFKTDVNLDGRNIINIVFEKPEIGVAEVDSGGIDLSIRDGYMDCMRAFGRTEGKKYYINSRSYRAARRKYSEDLILSLETAAEIFGLDKRRIYTFDELVKNTLDAYYTSSDEFNDANTFEKIRSLGDKAASVYLVNAKEGIITDSLSIFPGPRRAAAAIKYFMGKK